MISESDSELLRREAELLKLPHVYARALDRCQTEIFSDLFTKDAVFERTGKSLRFYAEICQIPSILAVKYHSTFHAVFNQVFDIKDQSATGEVYCIAHHLFKGLEGHDQSLNLLIRYSDRYEFGNDGRWRFKARKVVVDGQQIVPILI